MRPCGHPRPSPVLASVFELPVSTPNWTQAVNRDQILHLLKLHKPELAARFGVADLALFGSAVHDRSRPDSDVDFLVIEREVPSKHAEMVRLDEALSPLRIPVDVIVASEAHVASSWADFPGTYLYDALREGKVMYAMDGTGALALAQSAR